MAHPLPAAALDKHVAILGKTGSGKSNAAKVIAEDLLDAGERVCAIDPTGTWYGMRLDRSGKRASPYKMVIFGGAHADLAIGAGAGAAVAETVGTSTTPAIIDTRSMTVGERTRFFTAFAETLLQKNRGPLHLIIDEAHLFAPQGKVADPKSGEMLHAVNNLVSLGRGIGLRIIMLSQRPAKLHKDSLTQVETLVAMRVIAPQDRRAVEDWIGEWTDPKQGAELVGSLPSLPTGDAWVWSPEIGLLKRDRFPLARSFDSGKPRAGAALELTPIDVESVAARLEAVAKEAIENDPKRLKAEVAKLRRELASATGRPAEPDPREVEAAERRGFERGSEQGFAEGWLACAAQWRERIAGVLSEMAGESPEPPKVADPPPRPAPARPAPVRPAARPSPRVVSATPSDRPLGAERRPLAVLRSVYPAGMTEAQWAVGSGLKRAGGTWRTYLSRLRTAGRIENRGDLWFATEQGFADLGDVPAVVPPPGPELVEFWAERISGAGPMLRELARHYPGWLTHDELAEALGLAATGGTFRTYLSRLRSPGLIETNGTHVRAADILFP